MMRARHMPFPITPERAEAWLGCMRGALAEIGLPEELQVVYTRAAVWAGASFYEHER